MSGPGLGDLTAECKLHPLGLCREREKKTNKQKNTYIYRDKPSKVSDLVFPKTGTCSPGSLHSNTGRLNCTIATVVKLPSGIFEVSPVCVFPAAGLEKPLSQSGLAQYHRYGGEATGGAQHPPHAPMDLKNC